MNNPKQFAKIAEKYTNRSISNIASSLKTLDKRNTSVEILFRKNLRMSSIKFV
jgi:hypothetical protein